MNYTKVENGNLYLRPNDYKYSWGLLVLMVFLLFIPIVNIFSICYLLPKSIFDNNVKKKRALYYEIVCDGEYSAINGGHSQNYDITVDQDVRKTNSQTLYMYPNRFYQLVLISLGTLLLQMFVANFFGFIGFFLMGYLAIQYADEYAQTIVAEELMNNPTLVVHFPDGFKSMIQTNLENKTNN